MDADGYLHLTEAGNEVACKIYERHRTLTDMLTGMGVPKDTAESDACRIEHVISDESFDRLKGVLAKIDFEV